MKNISLLFAIECILLSVFPLDFNHVFVVCQPGPAMSEILRQMLAQAPIKILSLVQLGLLARLLRQRRNRLATPGADGIDNDRDGLVDEEDEGTSDSNRKNVMVFLGKHNIQVSNHGIKKDEEEVQGEEDIEEELEEECGEECEDVNSEEEEEEYSGIKQGDQYMKDKGGKDSGEEKNDNKRKRKPKKHKKRNKKKYTKPSYGDDEEDIEEEKDVVEGEGDEPNYMPTFISYANSNNKPTKTLLPWIKSLYQNNDKIDDNLSTGHKDSNIMSLPNGFPIGGSKLNHFNKRSDEKLEELMEYLPSESEISELLSNPEVIEFLHKLNETLINASKSEDLKRSKRQLKHNYSRNLTAQELRQSKQSKYSSIQSFNIGLRSKNFSNSSPNHFKNNVTYYSDFNPMNGQKVATNRLSNDLMSQSSLKSVKHFQPKESTKSYKLGENMTFKPLATNLKTSASINEPSYGDMAITDDNVYPYNEGSNYGNSGSEYGSERPEYGENYPKSADELLIEVYGRPGQLNDGVGGTYNGMNGGMHGDVNTMPYGGYGGAQPENTSPETPHMDLSYWTRLMKKTEKKKKKKKKYATTEATTTTEDPEEVEDEYEDYEEEVEVPSKKIHSTIQIIKSGSKTGNIGINSNEDEDRSLKGWVRGLPGFRSLFGRR